jgi:hypothetical protein
METIKQANKQTGLWHEAWEKLVNFQVPQNEGNLLPNLWPRFWMLARGNRHPSSLKRTEWLWILLAHIWWLPDLFLGDEAIGELIWPLTSYLCWAEEWVELYFYHPCMLHGFDLYNCTFFIFSVPDKGKYAGLYYTRQALCIPLTEEIGMLYELVHHQMQCVPEVTASSKYLPTVPDFQFTKVPIEPPPHTHTHTQIANI